MLNTDEITGMLRENFFPPNVHLIKIITENLRKKKPLGTWQN
jgi:hypothetical protein